VGFVVDKVGFVVNKMGLGQVFFKDFGFPLPVLVLLTVPN
jgi:hypothetical protein